VTVLSLFAPFAQELQCKQEEALREFASRQAEETIVKLKPSKHILELLQVRTGPSSLGTARLPRAS
jgi:hypothetical protein